MPYHILEHITLPGTQKYHFLPQHNYTEMLFNLASFGHEYLAPQYYIDREDCDVYMINYIINGKVHFQYGADESGNCKNYTLNPGDCAFFYLGEKNRLYPLTNNAESFVFHIKDGAVSSYYRSIVEKGGNIIHGFPSSVIADTFDFLSRIFDGDGCNHLAVSEQINKLLFEMLLFSNSKTDNMSLLGNRVMQIVINKNATVEDIANELGFHPVYLERLFKKETGKSLRSVMKERKLEAAENYLLTTNMSIESIAHQLGYGNSNGLIQLFKKEHGITPLAYRKKNGLFK